MSEKYTVGVGVGVIVLDGENILLQQRQGAHGANTWAPPGGKIDHSEDPVVTAKREVKEETNVDIEDIEFIGFTNDVFETDGLHYVTLWYIGKVALDSPDAQITEPHKCLEQEWVPYQDLISDAKRNWFLTVQHLQQDDSMIKNIEDYIHRA